MNLLVQFCRWFVGILFIFSGLVKLNDPVGFSFKLDEYFSGAVLGLEFLQPFVLPIAIFLVILEVILGLMLLIGFQKKFTVWSLLLMILFFTFLTFYSAYFNKVTDCGCFGDAIPLTPWQSFGKDVLLLFMIVILFMNVRLIQPLFKKFTSMVVIMLASIGCLALTYYVLMHLPVIDFRSFKIGTNIDQAMQMDPSRPDVYGFDWYYDVNGQEEILTTTGQVPVNRPNYTRVETRLIEKGYEPPIHDFSIESTENGDITSEVLTAPRAALIVMYNLRHSESKGVRKLNAFIINAQKKGYETMVLTSASPDAIQQLKNTYDLEIPFYTTDGTALKTMIRSNPGVVLLNDGVVTNKAHWNDLEDLEL